MKKQKTEIGLLKKKLSDLDGMVSLAKPEYEKIHNESMEYKNSQASLEKMQTAYTEQTKTLLGLAKAISILVGS